MGKSLSSNSVPVPRSMILTSRQGSRIASRKVK